MTPTTDWEPTRHGGMRRRTRVAQKMGNSGEASTNASTAAAVGKRMGAEPGKYFGRALSRNTKEVVGSNPAPRTQFILKFNEKLGVTGCEYLVRWRFETPWGSIRLHHWLGPDDDRARHDHPWSFVTFVLRGGYTDLSPAGDQHLKAPAIQYRHAEHQHTVVPDNGGAWTIIVTGPKIRSWGFWVAGKFKKANKYFLTYGHHPCD